MSDTDLNELENRILDYERRLESSKDNMKILKEMYSNLSLRKKSLQSALDFVIEVDIKTRENLELAVSRIASNALSSIFGDDAYQLETDFVPRRGQTECDISFTKDGRQFADPEFDSGGGAINVASYALRISIMTIGEVIPILIADQPFKDLSAKHHEDFVEFFKSVSENMGLQMIIISHLPEQIRSASKTFEIEKGKVINIIEENKGETINVIETSKRGDGAPKKRRRKRT